jgi:MOSC domain-containing protein YiiM
MDGKVVSLHVHPPEHWVRLPAVDEVGVTEAGIDGDVHAGRGDRSILLVATSDLDEVGLVPGDLREQVTVDLPELMALQPGTRLEVGDAILEIAKACEPCTHIGEHVGVQDREAFRRRLVGRRGMLAGVAEVRGEGRIRVGDSVLTLTNE